MTDYINGQGNIFKTDYKKMDSHPDNKGKIKIPSALVKKMVGKFKENPNQPEIEMEVALWNRKGKDTGKPYIFLRIEMPYVKEDPSQVTKSQEAEQIAKTVAISESENDVPF
jgi:hypothetical protein